jgi:hypothetical protein
MGVTQNAYKLLIGKPQGKTPLGRPTHIWENNINMNLKERGHQNMEQINLPHDRSNGKTL